ncbi:MAG: GNAT family N-acetyltransferase [Acidimicrobiales bacterium]
MKQAADIPENLPESEITVDDPRSDDIRELLEFHLDFCNLHSPPEDVHAMDVEGLTGPEITFVSLRVNGQLLAVGALKQLDAQHAELKSMHTVSAARGRGIARRMVDHLVGIARDRGVKCLSIETGSMEAFAPARALYASAGFTECGPFGDYVPSVNSTFMTKLLDGESAPSKGSGDGAGRRISDGPA